MSLIKFVTAILAIIILGFLIFWLWQRQPKINNQEAQAPQATIEAAQKSPDQIFQINPDDSQVLTTAKINFQGKTAPGELVAIYSNTFQTIATTDQSGNFVASWQLSPNLNLINISKLNKNLDKDYDKFITLYLAKDLNSGKIVFAGSVKSIFDTLLTITTANGEKNTRSSINTNFNLPKDTAGHEASSSVKNIRIGDYEIALGDKPSGAQDDNTIIANDLTIIRQEKPVNLEQLATGKIATAVTQNIFSVKNAKGELMELTINKNSSISNNGKDAKIDSIQKDKSAIVIYHPGTNNNNILDLVYILP